MNILITGGAGFVGSYLSMRFNADGHNVTVLDNLKRRGSELNLKKFSLSGISFTHGDIRNLNDLNRIDGTFDLLIDASAEPSVHSGINDSPDYLIDTNLYGTINILEYAKQNVKKTIFLSTSRVYSIEDLKSIPLIESDSRLVIDSSAKMPTGISPKGISELFETKNPRSLYGTTKLCSEYFIQEYVLNHKLDVVINRCGVIAGPGQWGKVDQGVFTLWVANHYFKKSLRYTGFGGKGKQVRDLLHPEDLYQLINIQVSHEKLNTKEFSFNVGGSNSCSTSLLELTKHCEEITGNKIDIASVLETADVDIPYYISDITRAEKRFSWKPLKTSKDIVNDIFDWLREEEDIVKTIFNS